MALRVAVGIISSPGATEQRAYIRRHLSLPTVAASYSPPSADNGKTHTPDADAATNNRDRRHRHHLHHSQLSSSRMEVLHRFVIGTRDVDRPRAQHLEREAEAHANDLLLLPRACGSGKCLAAKSLAWFQAALTLFTPAADYYIKMDPDTFVVWPGLASLLLDTGLPDLGRSDHHSNAAPRATAASPSPAMIYGGRIMWSSFYRHARRWCGCCAGSAGHAALLHSATAPTFPMGGACAGPNSCLLATEDAVDGPYPYATGPFYLASRALAAWLVAQPFYAPLAEDLLHEAEMDKELEWVEDVLFGWVVHQRANVTILSVPTRMHHDVDHKPMTECSLSRKSSKPRAVEPFNFTLPGSGARRVDAPDEYGFVSPASVFIHHVRDAKQWAAVEATLARIHASEAAPPPSNAAAADEESGSWSTCALDAVKIAQRRGHVFSWTSAGTRFWHDSGEQASFFQRWERGIKTCNKTRVGSR